MPTAANFAYLKQFSPDAHCVQDKTTAQLNALSRARIETTLAGVMAYWWNLYTVTLFVSTTISGAASKTWTSLPMFLGNGDPFGSGGPEAIPRDRVCAQYAAGTGHGITCTNDVTDPLYPGDGGNVGFWFRQVYYNTDTALYALQLDAVFVIASDYCRTWDPGAGWVSNSGTVTIFGSVVSSWKPSGSANVTMTISNPTYYTY